MASLVLKRSSFSTAKSTFINIRSITSVSVGADLPSAAPDVSLQKARTWDEGVSSKFSTTPLKDILKDKKVVIFGLPGAFTGVCTAQHVPSYKNNIDKFKAKGINSVICVAVNDPYVMNGWAEKLQAKEAIEFYGDFDGSFHKSLGLDLDLSGALLGRRSQRWSAYLEDGKVKVLNVEKVPSEFKVSGGESKQNPWGALELIVNTFTSMIQSRDSQVEEFLQICKIAVANKEDHTLQIEDLNPRICETQNQSKENPGRGATSGIQQGVAKKTPSTQTWPAHNMTTPTL